MVRKRRGASSAKRLPPKKTLCVCRYDNGDYYKGETDAKGTRHGFGRYIHAEDGAVKVGAWKDGQLEGLAWMHFPATLETYQGETKAGQKDGRGTESCPDGTYTGDWVGGERSGFGEEHLTASGVSYRGAYQIGYWEGSGCMTSRNGTRHQGFFVHGFLHGEAVLRFDDRSALSCTYVHGEIQGKGVWRYADGHAWFGTFHDGEQTGPGMAFWPNVTRPRDPNWEPTDKELKDPHPFVDLPTETDVAWPRGVLFQGEFSDGKRVGKGTTHGPSGILHATYGNDVPDERSGPASFQYANGDRWVGYFESHDRAFGTRTLADGVTTVEGWWENWDLSVLVPSDSAPTPSVASEDEK